MFQVVAIHLNMTICFVCDNAIQVLRYVHEFFYSIYALLWSQFELNFQTTIGIWVLIERLLAVLHKHHCLIGTWS